MPIPLILIACGLVAGFLSGLIGIGGGVILIPFLIYFIGVPIHTAIGTSLLVIAPTAFIAGIPHFKAGRVNVTYALIILSASLIAAIIGAKTAVHLPDDILRKCVAIVLLIVSIKMFIGK